MIPTQLRVSLLVCASWPLCAAAEELANVLDALEARAQQLEAGVFHFVKTTERPAREPMSERALRKRVQKRVERFREAAKAAGRKWPEHVSAQFIQRELAISKEVQRRRAENSVSRYAKALYIDPPFVRLETREIVEEEEREKRIAGFVARAMRADPWASEEDLRSGANTRAEMPTTQMRDGESMIDITPSGKAGLTVVAHPLPEKMKGPRLIYALHPARYEQLQNVDTLRSLRVELHASTTEGFEDCLRLDTFRDDALVSQRWVNPKYGYALARIVPYSRKGRGTSTTSYSRFKKLSNGVWWAMRCERCSASRREVWEYTSVKLGRAPRLTKLKLPVGTRVHDARVEPQVMYVTDARHPWILPLSEAEALVAEQRAQREERRR